MESTIFLHHTHCLASLYRRQGPPTLYLSSHEVLQDMATLSEMWHQHRGNWHSCWGAPAAESTYLPRMREENNYCYANPSHKGNQISLGAARSASCSIGGRYK